MLYCSCRNRIGAWKPFGTTAAIFLCASMSRHRDYVLRQPRGGGRRSLASVQNAMAELMEGSHYVGRCCSRSPDRRAPRVPQNPRVSQLLCTCIGIPYQPTTFTLQRNMPKLPTIAMATSIPPAIGRRCVNRLARPATCISTINARTFATTRFQSSHNSFHKSNKSGITALGPSSSKSTRMNSDEHARDISAIAQRLPSEEELSLRLSHRFREFEVFVRIRNRERARTDWIAAGQARLHCDRRSTRSRPDTC